MEKETQRPGIFLRLLFVVVAAFALTGCLPPPNNITRIGGQLEGYHKVYFVMADNDPRAVFPRVVSRLRQIGFDVTVVNPNGPPVNMQGSGFVLSPEGLVLTCAHVVGNQPHDTIWIEGVRYPCRLLNSDTNLDLALLQVEGDHPPFHALSLSPATDYSLGQNVFTMGFPLVEVLGTSPRLGNGLISAKVGMDDDTNFVQISVPVQPGNSGGPLLDANSKVIGVVSSTLNPMGVLVCICDYDSTVDFYWHFRVIAIQFRDAKTGKEVLTVGQGLGSLPEDRQLNRIFSEISEKFFPNQPNPFGGR